MSVWVEPLEVNGPSIKEHFCDGRTKKFSNSDIKTIHLLKKFFCYVFYINFLLVTVLLIRTNSIICTKPLITLLIYMIIR